jgi:hypothetical protein
MSAPRDNCQCRIIPVARRSGSVPPFPYSIKRDAVTVEYCPMHAAAPELLEALKAMMHYDTIAAMMSLPIGKQMRDIYGQASAAIAKAEETSPGRANQSSEPPQPTEAKS